MTIKSEDYMYIKITCTSLQLDKKHLQSFKKIGLKLEKELHSKDAQCLYVLVESEPKFTKFKLQRK